MLITDNKSLKSSCERFAHADFLTIDTEFIRERTYWPKLCLIQIASGEEAVAIDPLAGGIDLTPLFTLLSDELVLKVFHACKQDVEIFYHLTRRIPTPLFDTQVAAQVCGHGESAGYETLVNKLLDRPLDKSQRFTDWAHRPLSQKQLDYALADVTHLREIYSILQYELRQGGRTGWIEEEMSALSDPATYEPDMENLWKKIKHRLRKPRQLAILRELAKWREVEAQRRDVPRGRVIKDDTLVEIAQSTPTSESELRRIRGFGNNMPTVQISSLLDTIADAMEMPEEKFPRLPRRKPLPKEQEPVADLLRLLLKMQCNKNKVTPRLVAGKDDMEALLLAGDRADIPALKGWRREIFGQSALDLLSGKLAFGVAPADRTLTIIGQ